MTGISDFCFLLNFRDMFLLSVLHKEKKSNLFLHLKDTLELLLLLDFCMAMVWSNV